MKTINIKLSSFALAICLIVFLTMCSCATKTRFMTSKTVPAAQGTVEVKTDKNKNYIIKIEITNLSPSTRLSPPYNAYVVWLITESNTTRNLGQLNSSSNFMSKNLDAKFETVSSSKPAKIIITAENEPDSEYPSYSEVILATDNLNIKN